MRFILSCKKVMWIKNRIATHLLKFEKQLNMTCQVIYDCFGKIYLGKINHSPTWYKHINNLHNLYFFICL